MTSRKKGWPFTGGPSETIAVGVALSGNLKAYIVCENKVWRKATELESILECVKSIEYEQKQISM